MIPTTTAPLPSGSGDRGVSPASSDWDVSPASSSTLVVAHFNEDLGWLASLDRERYPRIVVITKGEAPSGLPPGVEVWTQRPNRGYEASAYAEFLAREYDSLPPVVTLVHGHRRSWHHDGDIHDILNALDFRAPYRNFNCDRFCGELCLSPEELDELPRHGFLVGPPPARYVTRCCAQFYVRAGAVRRHPRAAYEALLASCLEDGSREQGTRLEHLWFRLFTGEDDEAAWDARWAGEAR